MQAGKLSHSDLQQLVFAQIQNRRSEVILAATLGEDSAALDLAGQLVVVSTDPITGAGQNAAWLAVHVSCNDVAANGAEPVAVLLTLLLPVGFSPAGVGQLIRDAERAALEVNVQIIGGHTEFTPAVNQPVVSTAVIGKVEAGKLARSSEIRPGDSLVVSKWIGLEGTAIIATDYPELVRPLLGEQLLQAASKLSQAISIVPEARIAARLGVRAMHDATEGGVLGAAYEMAAAAGLGFTLDAEQMPLHPATALIAQQFGLDPLRLISSGTLLMACQQPDRLLAELNTAGISAQVIGQFTAEPDKLILRSGQVMPVDAPESDELWRFIQEQASRISR